MISKLNPQQAVALAYLEHSGAPKVVAKGQGLVAEKIMEVGNGALVRVKGRVKVERWSEGGDTKSAVRIAAESVSVLCY